MDKVFIIMVNLIDVLTFPRNLIYYLIISLTSETVTVQLSIFILGWGGRCQRKAQVEGRCKK